MKPSNPSTNMILCIADKEVQAQREKEKEMEELLADVAGVFKIDLTLIKGGETKHMCAVVRKIFYYIGHEKFNYPYKKMAIAAGRIDHAHCSYHIKRVRNFLKVGDPGFKVLWEHYLEYSKFFTKNDFL